MLPEGSTFGNNWEGILSLTKSIRPPPCSILSRLYGGVNHCKMEICRLTLFQILAKYQSITNYFFYHFRSVPFELIFKWAIMTVKNTVVSPDFLVWKFCGKAKFPHSFGDSPETMQKLCLSAKFLHQEIRWNNGIFRSVWCNLGFSYVSDSTCHF